MTIIQVILTLAFVMAGAMKAFTPYEELREGMAWVEDFPPFLVKLIGILEILGALGLVAPLLIKGLPSRLMVYAAFGLAITMVGAFLTHLLRGEMLLLLTPIVLLLLALSVLPYLRKNFW